MAKEKKSKSAKKETGPKKQAAKKPADVKKPASEPKIDNDAMVKAEEEARIKAEQEAKAKADEEARIKAEQEAKAKADEEARIKAEQEAKAKADEEARIKAEQETAEDVIQTPAAVTPLKSFKPAINIKAVAAFVAILVFVVTLFSIRNASTYYVTPKHGVTLLYKGAFAPTGQNLIATIPGKVLPAHIKDVYTEKDILPLLFTYYVGQADEIQNKPGTPNFAEMKCALNKAIECASSNEEKQCAKRKLAAVDAIMSTYSN